MTECKIYFGVKLQELQIMTEKMQRKIVLKQNKKFIAAQNWKSDKLWQKKQGKSIGDRIKNLSMAEIESGNYHWKKNGKSINDRIENSFRTEIHFYSFQHSIRNYFWKK